MNTKSQREILRWLLDAFFKKRWPWSASNPYMLPRDSPKNRIHHPAEEGPEGTTQGWSPIPLSTSVQIFFQSPPLNKRSTRLDSTSGSWLTRISPLPRHESAFIYYGLNIWSWVRTSEGKGGSVSLDSFLPPHSVWKTTFFKLKCLVYGKFPFLTLDSAKGWELATLKWK